MYMINDYFIVPWTRNTGASIALLFNPKGLRAEAMASHAWLEVTNSYCVLCGLILCTRITKNSRRH